MPLNRGEEAITFDFLILLSLFLKMLTEKPSTITDFQLLSRKLQKRVLLRLHSKIAILYQIFFIFKRNKFKMGGIFHEFILILKITFPS